LLIKNGNVHDGCGKVAKADLRVVDGRIAEIGKKLTASEGEEVLDAAGLEVLPGFVHAVTQWGVNGNWTEIRPSSNDNDERSEPITPELDAFYAFNGRACMAQQLGAFGITVVGVAPSDNNLFGGQIAAFSVEGVNPYKMCLRRGIGMKASVTNALKMSYGARQMAPMTRMWIFGQLEEQLRKAAEYAEKKAKEAAEKEKAEVAGRKKNAKKKAEDAPAPETPYDAKLEAIGKVLTGELPLFITCDSLIAAERVRDITSAYPAVKLVLINGYGLTGEEDWIIEKKIPIVVKPADYTVDREAMTLDLQAIAKLWKAGVPIIVNGNGNVREDLLWTGSELMRILGDSEEVLKMATSVPAKVLGIDDLTGSVQEGRRADLVLWQGDPMKTWDAHIVRTFCEGETIYREGDEMKCM